MIAPRDLGILTIGAVAAVSGVLAAVEVNTLVAPPTDATADDATADDPAPLPAGIAPPVAPGDGLGSIPTAIRDVLGSFAGGSSTAMDQETLARHVPPSVSELLTERGAVLVFPPDAELVP